MALYIPKMVVLQNDMLARCYTVLYILTGGTMLGWFLLTGGHWLPVSLKDTTRIKMWVNTPGDGVLNDTMLARQGDVCGSPSDYDYWWSEQWQYNGSRCIDVSSACNPYNGTCLRTADMHVHYNPREVFLATWTETLRRPLGGEAEEPARYYVPQVNAFSVSFQYFFTVPYRPSFRRNQLVSRPPVDEEYRLSNKEVMTVFLDSRRDIAWIAKPDEPLEISVPVLLEMAGYPDHLTKVNPVWGENEFPGAKYPGGPIGLIGGLPVEILVHCHKTPKRDLGEGYAYWTGPTCYVIANAQEMWSERHKADNLGLLGVQYTYQTGIRITGYMDGTWEYFDVNNCILSFTALLVLLQLPKTLMTLVSCRALGHLSKIYRNVVFQKFFIEEQIAGTAARILTHCASFREIEHTDDHGGLSNQGLHDAISYVAQPQKEASPPAHDVVVETRSVKASKIDEGNVLLFSDFAFNAICNPMYRGRGRIARLLRKVIGTRLMRVTEALLWCLLGEDFVVDDMNSERVGPQRISAGNFVSTAASSEQVRFEHLLWLFNRSRRISPLERWFTPSFVSKYLEQKRCEQSDAEKSQTPQYQEARADLELGDQGEVGLSPDNFRVSNRSLIKCLSEDLRLVRGSNGWPAASTGCRDGLSVAGLPGDCISSHPTPTRTLRLASGETLAPSTSTAANHARPPGSGEGAAERAEVIVSDIQLLAAWRAGHETAARGRTAADHARPPGHEEGGPSGAAAAARSGPHRPGVAAWSVGIHRAGQEYLRVQSLEARDGGGPSPRPVLCPGRPIRDSAAGAAGAEASDDGTRQPPGQGEDIPDCTPAAGDAQASEVPGVKIARTIRTC